MVTKLIRLCLAVSFVNAAQAAIVITGAVTPVGSTDPWVLDSSLAIGADGGVQVTGGSLVNAGHGIEITAGGNFTLDGGELIYGSLSNPIAFDGSVSGFTLNAGKLTAYGSFSNLPLLPSTSGGSGRILDHLQILLEGSSATWNETAADVYLGDALGTFATLTLKDSAQLSTTTATVAGYRGHGTLNVDGSRLTSSGNFYLGHLSGSLGELNTTNGSTLNTDGLFAAGSNGTAAVRLTNSTWASTGAVYFASNGNATIEMSGGAWTSQAFVALADSGSFGATFSAAATWTANEAVEIATFNGSAATMAFTGTDTNWTSVGAVTLGNRGTTTIQLADFAVWESKALVTMAVQAGSTANVNIASGATWDAQGGIAFGSGTSAITLNGGILKVGSVANPAAFLPAASQFTFNAGTLFLTAGTSNLTSLGASQILSTAAGTLFSDNLNVDGGTLVFRGSADLATSRVTFTSGTLETQGTLTGLADINALSTLRIVGSTAIWASSASSVLAGNLILDGGALTVGSGSVVTGLPGAAISFTDGTGGTIQLDGGTLNMGSLSPLQLKANAKVEGTGTLYGNIMMGTNLDHGSVLGASSTDRITVYGDLSGSGSIGNLRVFGNNTVGNSPGLQTWSGAVDLAPTGTLTMEVGGYEAGVTYSQITILENATITLGGSMTLVFSEGYVPAQSFDFLLFNKLGSLVFSGIFSALNLPSADGVSWDSSRLYSDGILTMTYAVPEAGQTTLVIALVCLCAVLLRRRMRSAQR